MAAAGTQAQLHPLVLLTITDTISRTITRGHTLPLLGGIVGQVTREGISLEHAFDLHIRPTSDGSGWEIDQERFSKRLWQIQEVHKVPSQLELVAFWTLGKSEQGPGPELKHILPELLKVNEAALCLIFHADVLVEGEADETKMPFTIYEPVYSEQSETTIVQGQSVKRPDSFKAISWEMATGEAEMISLEFVKNGAGNATRVRTGATTDSSSSAKEQPTKNGTKRDDSQAQQKTQRTAASDLYTAEEEEMLSFLTTRGNAIRTLLSRLTSIRGYTDKAQQEPAGASPEVLRAIKAMLARLPSIEAAKHKFAAAPQTTASTTETVGSASDPAISDAILIELLGSLSKNLQGTRELGGKFAAVESGRRERRQGREGYGAADFSSPSGTLDAMDLT